jgi:N-acetylmuramoyl-L-alanine amidase
MRIVLRLILAFAAALSACGAMANTITDMRVILNPGRDGARFVADLDAGPDYTVSRLSNPDRLVIDLPGVEFNVPEQPGEGRGLVSAYRYGLIEPGKARIVLDLAEPAEVVNSFVLDPVGAEPAHLAIDLVPTSRDSFTAAAERDMQLRAELRREEEPQDTSPLNCDYSGERPTGDLPVVVIDPGHGGIDSGAVGRDGLLEKDVTLKIGLALAEELKAGGIVTPVLTRDKDVFLSLAARANRAFQLQADLFVSIHADTVRQDYVRGATVYTLSNDASDKLARDVAEQENLADVRAGVASEDEVVCLILADLAHGDKMQGSFSFSDGLKESMEEEDFKLNNHPQRRASFKVLKAPGVPSVLFELGYLSNAEDEKLFRSEDWAKELASTAARAIEAFLGQRVTAGQPRPIQ